MKITSWTLAGLLVATPAAWAGGSIGTSVHGMSQMQGIAAQLEEATEDLQSEVRVHSVSSNQQRTEELARRHFDQLASNAEEFHKSLLKGSVSDSQEAYEDLRESFNGAAQTFSWVHSPELIKDEYLRVQRLMGTLASLHGESRIAFEGRAGDLILEEDDEVDYDELDPRGDEVAMLND